MSTVPAVGNQGPAAPPGEGGVTLLATILIVPAAAMVCLTMLSYFTPLEPPFTTSRAVVFAMQLFFWCRRAGGLVQPERVVAPHRAGPVPARPRARHAAARQQIASWRFDANALLAGSTLVLPALNRWYFGRPYVKQQCEARRQPARAKQAAAAADAPSTRVTYSRALAFV